jgi:hypothetical protein
MTINLKNDLAAAIRALGKMRGIIRPSTSRFRIKPSEARRKAILAARMNMAKNKKTSTSSAK